MRALLFPVAVLCLLAACSSTKLGFKPDMSQVAGQPEDYQDGWRDGCNSGYYAGGYTYSGFARDSARLEANALYRDAWHNAYKQCKKEFRTFCKENTRMSSAALYCREVWFAEPDD